MFSTDSKYEIDGRYFQGWRGDDIFKGSVHYNRLCSCEYHGDGDPLIRFLCVFAVFLKL